MTRDFSRGNAAGGGHKPAESVNISFGGHTMNKIIMWCKRHNLPYTVENIGYNMERIRIDIDDVYSYSAVTNQLYKVSNRNNWKIDSNVYTGTIRIYNYSDYDYLQEQNKNINYLVDLFYLTLREGKTQEEAKQKQYQYAIDNNMLVAFDSIYNR